MNNNINYTSNNSKFFDANEGFVKGNLNKDSYDGYKSYIPREPEVNTDKDACLLKVQKLDLATHDLVLYLDVFPNDESAVNLYTFYRNLLLDEKANYQKNYGPLDATDINMNETPFAWNQDPWPWEKR